MEEVTYKLKTEAGLCHGCLSMDRDKTELVEDVDLFHYLLGQNSNVKDMSETIMLCWECKAILRKVKQFQHRIMKAQIILQQSWHLMIYKEVLPLTTLQAVNLKDAPILIYEHVKETNTESIENIPNKVYDQPVNQLQDIHNMVKVKEEIDSTVYYIDVEFENVKEEYDENESGKKLDIEKEEQDIKINSKDVLKPKTIDTEPMKGKSIYSHMEVIKNNINIDEENIEKYIEQVFLTNEEMDELAQREYKKHPRKAYTCKPCSRNFRIAIEFNRHIMMNHLKDKPPHRCEECGHSFQSVKVLEAHWRGHNAAFRCVHCGEAHRLATAAKRHVITHKESYACRECGGRFRAQTHFREHYKAIHTISICDDCGNKYKSKNALRKHISQHHLPSKCEPCGMTFKSYINYYRHRVAWHPDKAKQNLESSYCVECNKQFISLLKYKNHVRTAHSKKRVPCPVCGKIFTRAIRMRHHYNLQHLKNSKHQCQICQKFFTTSTHLRKHTAVVHERRPRPPMQRTHVCDMCGRGFFTRRILTNHRRTHTGERPHACAHCGRGFAQLTAMKKHVKTQHRDQADVSIEQLKESSMGDFHAATLKSKKCSSAVPH